MKAIKAIILLTLTFGVITLNSCKKDDKEATVSTSISASIDGTATTFNNAVGLTGTVGGVKFTSVTGTASNKAVISITLNGTITAGKTYSAAAANASDKPLLLYAPDDNDDYFNDDSNTAKLVSVTVTSISATNIQGTFKGNVTNTISIGNGTGKIKSITNGKFNVTITGK